MTKTSRAALTAILAAFLLSGCTGTSQPTPSTSNSSSPPSTTTTAPSPSPSTTTTAPSPSPSTTTPDALAKEKSEAVLRAYFRASTECMFDPPKTPPKCFDAVAIASEKTKLMNTLSSAQSMETRTTGYNEVVSATVKSTALDIDLKKTPPVVPTVQWEVCYDVSKVNVIDRAGKSIVPPTRKPRGVLTVYVANYTYPALDGWRVALTKPEAEKSC